MKHTPLTKSRETRPGSGAKGIKLASGLAALAMAVALIGLLQRPARLESAVPLSGTQGALSASEEHLPQERVPTALSGSGQAASSELPAQVLEAQSGKVSVTVYAEEGALPEGTTLQLQDVVDDSTLGAASKAVKGKRQVDVKQVQAVDITFRNAAGEEIEPQKPVHVSMSSDGLNETEDAYVVHMDSAGNPEVVERSDASEAEGMLSFDSNEFSVYAIVVTETLETDVITADGKTYRVSVAYDEDARIPADAKLKVAEILEGSDSYEEAWDNTIRALSDENGIAVVSQMRLFDISIVRDGKELEPAAPVQVSVEYIEVVPTEENSEFQVVHFGEEEPEVLEVTLADPNAEEISSFQFKTESFSTFAFAQANYIGSLNGQTFAIVRDGTKNNVKDMVAISSSSKPDNRNRLQGIWVNDSLEEHTLTAVTDKTSTTKSDAHITTWTFEYVRDNIYYVKSDDDKYLTIDKENLTAGDKPFLIEVVPISITSNGGADNHTLSSKVYLRSAEDTRYCVNVKMEGSPSTPGFKGSTFFNDDSSLSLYAADTLSVFERISNQKIGATDIQGGQYIVIYQRVWNDASGKYENYVVDGNGKLVYAFDEGDIITYRSADSALTQWYVIEYIDEATGKPSGYYDFQNAKTGKYLAPQFQSILSDKPLGVLLNGKADGKGTSTIEGWDKIQVSYIGYQLDLQNQVLLPATGSDSSEFSFALPKDLEPGTLHTVETVDSSASGITIKMYDFPNRDMMNLYGDNNFYDKGTFKQGLLQKKLGDDGLPVSKTGHSLSEIYNDTYYKGEGNHLFLKSIYDSTGYYEYSAFNNFASYDASTKEFTVYNERGIPVNGVGGSASSYLRGNFLPYNTLDVGRVGTNTRLYDNRSDLTNLENPYFDSELYLMGQDVDYYFGTIVEASFLQSQDGLDEHGNPIIYEFNGDDDLWVYIDGVLVLDIGGIHSAVTGTINFTTGAVDIEGTKTTIKQCFKDAGVFPDGTAWTEETDNLINNYFRGDTFADFSGHNMKMFYQERGAGASTLKVRFNLPVIKSGTFAVEKQLTGTKQQEYTSVQFAYQAFVEDKAGNATQLYPGVILSPDGTAVDPKDATDEQQDNAVGVTYESTGTNVDFYDTVEIGGKPYDNVFYLKPGEASIFSGIPDGVKYYVQEIDVSGAYYETVMINEANMGTEGGKIPEDSNITAQSSSKTIQERQRVLFQNQCSPKNLRKLCITKVLEGPANDSATFEFRVKFEGSDGTLKPYHQGEYYVVKEVDGKEHYFSFVNNVLTDQGETRVVCSTSGPEGTIADIPAGYAVVIDGGLLAGTHFKVEELFRSPYGDGYQQVGKAAATNCDAPDLEDADGKIQLGKDAQVTITNAPAPQVSLLKVSSGTAVPLSGARFTLYSKYDPNAKADENVIQTSRADGKPIEDRATDAEGTLFLSTLSNGTYYLVETAAPGAYMLLDAPVVFTVNGTTVTVEQGASAEPLEDGVYTITVENESVYELPYSGGTGTMIFTVVGIIIMVLAAALLWRHKRHQSDDKEDSDDA